VELKWKEASILLPAGRMVHQHFNTSTHPAAPYRAALQLQMHAQVENPAMLCSCERSAIWRAGCVDD